MIGWLQGNVVEKNPPFILLDVKGVGYEVAVPMTTFYRLPSLQEVATLFIHMVVREDNLALYGFTREQERHLFRQIIKVNGIGPKLALALMSNKELEELVACLKQGNIAALVKIPGIGKKTAERMVIEMQDGLKKWETDSREAFSQPLFVASQERAKEEAIAALIALGYKPKEATSAVNKIYTEGLSCEQAIRLALQG